MKNFRVSWFVGGVIALLFIFGLFWDVWQSYAAKVSLERYVRRAAEAGAQQLPFKIKEARDAALAVLAEKGLEPKPEFVSISPDGKKMTVEVTSEVNAYVAWIFGSSTMKFQASTTAEVMLKGGGPVDRMKLEEVSFALNSYSDFKPGQNVVLWAAGDSSTPEYALKVMKLTGPAELVVGGKAELARIDSLSPFKERKTYYVAMLDGSEGNENKIKGFAAFNATGMTENGNLSGQFIRTQVDGTLVKELPDMNNFGLLRGGTPQVQIR